MNTTTVVASRPAYTVAQFCADHCISRTHFYQLVKDGRGPRMMKLGRRTLISAEAAADWRRQIELESAGPSFWEANTPAIY